MKTYPILFTAPMIQALLAGTKSQTRRVVKPQPDGIGPSHWYCHPTERWWTCGENTGRTWRCPYGVPGDLLWVKETFAGRQSRPISSSPLWYRADGETKTMQSGLSFYDDRDRWRSPRFMPRWASRLTLELTDVRVQRVREISEADARAEGITDGGCLNCGKPEPCGCASPTPDARDSFAGLWDSINSTRGYGWDVNPWVWALSFRVHRANVDAVLAQRAAA